MADERGDSGPSRWSRFVQGPQQDQPLRKKFLAIITAPLRWLGYYALEILAILLMLILFLGAGVYVYNAYSGGTLQLRTTQVQETLVKTPIGPFLRDTLKVIKDPSIPLRTISWQAEVDKNAENKELGLTFGTFRFSQTAYSIKEQKSIIFSGNAKIRNLKDKAMVKFTCEASTTKFEGNIIKPNEPVILEKDFTTEIPVTCEIPIENIKLKGAKIAGETVIVKADYEFKSLGYVEAYTMSSKLLKEKIINLENPLENEQNPRLNKETGITKAEYTPGPMAVIIHIRDKQPFTEAGPPFSSNVNYDLDLLIEKISSFYQGRLNKLNNVVLYLPKNFELVDRQDRFEFVENENEVFYKMKQEEIKKLNSACQNYGFLDVECQNYWERGFVIATLNFKVNSLNKEDLDQDFIRAEVEYEFQAQTSQTARIVEGFEVA